MLTRWIAHTAVRALPFTLFLGVLLGSVRAWDEVRAGLWLLVFDELQRGLVLAAGLTLLFFLASLLFRGMARSLGLDDVPATALGTAAALAPIFSVAGYEINRRLLPGITEPLSIVGNLVMLVAMVYFWSFLGRWFAAFRANPPGAMPSPLRYWPLVAIAAVPVFLGVLRAGAPTVPVLFVLIDTLRADRLGCYGNPLSPSPSLDRLAREGILYQDVVTPATSTKSSIASLFTGKDVHAHGVYVGNREDREGYVTQRIREEEETMAEAFRDAGYVTVAWVQNGHVSKLSRYDQGFTSFTENAGSVNTIHDRFRRWFPRGHRYPFFAYLHIIDVHGPYKPPAPWNKLYGADAFSLYDKVPIDDWRDYVRGTRLGEYEFGPEEMRKIRSLYDGQIKLVDSVLGTLFEELRAADLYDSMCIVVTSDHGDGFQEHGFMGHSHHPYTELTHVPLIVKLPGGARAGTIETGQFRLRDLGSQVAVWAGIPPPSTAAPAAESDLIVSENHISTDAGEFPVAVSVRNDSLKMIRLPDGRQTLYHIGNDPAETIDRTAGFPEAVARFSAVVDRIGNERARNIDQAVLPKSTVDELKALGYVGD